MTTATTSTHSVTLRPCVKHEGQVLDNLMAYGQNQRQKRILKLLSLGLPHLWTTPLSITPVASDEQPQRIRIYLSNFEDESAITCALTCANKALHTELLRNMMILGYLVDTKVISTTKHKVNDAINVIETHKAAASAPTSVDFDIEEIPASSARVIRLDDTPSKQNASDRVTESPATKVSKSDFNNLFRINK